MKKRRYMVTVELFRNGVLSSSQSSGVEAESLAQAMHMTLGTSLDMPECPYTVTVYCL